MAFDDDASGFLPAAGLNSVTSDMPGSVSGLIGKAVWCTPAQIKRAITPGREVDAYNLM